MVFFNCNACGEALKKNQVDKHTFRCRQCQSVSCVDCGKDFWGSEYQNHTKCMTENEKYCGPGYVEKVNKGEVKQEQWIEKVQEAIDKASSNPKLKGLLQRLQDYPNIPRKKPKFENFLKNSLRVLNQGLISQVWELLMTTANNPAENKTNQSATSQPSPSVKNDDANTNVNGTQKNGDININGTQKNGDLNTNVNETHSEADCENVKEVKLNKREKKEERQKKHKKEKKDKVSQDSNENVEKVKKKKKRKHEEVLEDQSNISDGVEAGKKRKRDNENTDADEEPISKKKKKKKKNKQEDEGEENGDTTKADVITKVIKKKVIEKPSEKKKFRWGPIITDLLKKKGEMPVKKLRRKVLAEFAAQDAANYNEENLTAKFNKKLKKVSQVVIAKERVKLKWM